MNPQNSAVRQTASDKLISEEYYRTRSSEAIFSRSCETTVPTFLSERFLLSSPRPTPRTVCGKCQQTQFSQYFPGLCFFQKKKNENVGDVLEIMGENSSRARCPVSRKKKTYVQAPCGLRNLAQCTRPSPWSTVHR